MSHWKSSFNMLSLLLIVSLLALSGYLYYQWITPFSSIVSTPDQTRNISIEESGGEREVVLFSPTAISSYAEITERPLFVEGRLPPPAESEPKKAVARSPSKPLRLKLEGVAITPKNKVAIIRDLDSNELLRVSQGMNKHDWKVESVDSSSATIVRKDVKLVLKLEIDSKPKKKKRSPTMKLPFKPSKR
ncbi:MAG: hypothetical protein KZQ78_04700 [Candidatus Thiodiazotropha sp. (ex Ustalcina ferruginea)]|nr:hypothetical protein [Candidatus Thiodiazotropha sp. (ex Ustalcina ferruginea)]